jgi:hypothetical protein
VKGWLPLSEYSSKYKVSISTLRRRIKTEKALYRFEEGKYLLKDSPLKEHKIRKLQTSPSGSFAPPPQNEEPEVVIQTIKEDSEKANGPFLTAAQEMLNELKRAYSVILQEKEEQVLLLKDELADLRTLVGVLEEENNRLKHEMSESHSFERWLADPEMTQR